MPESSTITLLKKLGIFIRYNAFAQKEINELLKKSQTSEENLATVRTHGGIYTEDEKSRKTKIIDIEDNLSKKLKNKLLNLIPEVENHFKLDLSDCQEPQLLKYETGNFFKKHVDRSDDCKAASFSKSRLISTVIFLNTQADKAEENCFCGGSLLFYGLMKSNNNSNVAIPLKGQKGMMVCFNSNTIHEVIPVTNGTRYTLVSWYT